MAPKSHRSRPLCCVCFCFYFSVCFVCSAASGFALFLNTVLCFANSLIFGTCCSCFSLIRLCHNLSKAAFLLLYEILTQCNLFIHQNVIFFTSFAFSNNFINFLVGNRSEHFRYNSEFLACNNFRVTIFTNS